MESTFNILRNISPIKFELPLKEEDKDKFKNAAGEYKSKGGIR